MIVKINGNNILTKENMLHVYSAIVKIYKKIVFKLFINNLN